MRILSWNIQWGRGMDGRVDVSRIVREIRRLGGFDVICLQEVAIGFTALTGYGEPDQMAALQRLLPEYQGVFLPATDIPGSQGKRCQFGNAVFTRLPMLQVFRHLFPWPATPDTPSMQRGLLEVNVQSPFGPLRVMTTHLEYYSAACRATAMERVRVLHLEACAHGRQPRVAESKPGGPFAIWPRPMSAILCGDMNSAPDAVERGALTGPFSEDGIPAFRDAWRVLHEDVAHPPTVGIHPVDFVDGPTHFDSFYITADLQSRVLEVGVDAGTQASDHQPTWLSLSAQ